ncbi:MAG: hypothetical protein J6Q13_00400, partial [Clostridia bacterium]|nr:hypothetical protein [Clostridia bacterium]
SSFAKSYDFTDDSVANPEIVNYTVTNGVSNSLIISKVPKDLIVRAVFDYQYINLSIDENIIETLALNKETLSVKGEQIEVLYPQDTQSSFKTQSNGITTYTNAIVNSNYFKQVHFDGESLYTTPLKHTTDSETIKIEYSRGAFRYNDGYNVEFDLNLVAKMEDSKNYDVKSFYVNGVTIADANVDIVKDEFLRTSSFAVSGSIVENSLLTWKADMLTVVDLVPYVKNGIQLAEATGDDVAIIANQVRIDHHYSTVSTSRYLIKHSSLNENKQPETIKYEQFAGKQVEGENYFYFEIDSIRDSADNVFKKNNNFELGIVPTKAYEQFKMVYAPINFEIKFEARLSSNLNEKFTELDLNMSSQLRVRGQQYSLSSDDVSYAGYELKGFSTDLVDIQEDSITVEIDKNKPRDITIYLIFDKIDYVVRLNNVNNLILTKNNPDSTTTTIYTIASVKAYKGAQLTESYSETENANAGLFTQNSYLFITNYLLKESFKVQINASAGFKIGLSLSPSAMNSAVLNRSVELSQLIDEEFLNEYASGIKVENGKYIIELYLHAEYETYTFTYKINPATHGSNSVIMADISATKPDRDDVVMTQTEEGSTDPKSKVITITNVRLYDEIIIKAVVKTLPGSTNYYTFQKFISSGGIGLSGVVNNKPEFTYTYVVAGEETITAVLSAPESQLQISIDNAAAYDIGQIQVFFDKNKDGEVTLAEEDLATSENDVFMVSGEIKVVLNGIANIEAGYYYSGFELYLFEDGVEQSAGIETEFAGGVISFIMVSPEAHELRISCPEKTYKISATQVGAGVPDSDVEFSGDLSFINLSMSNLLLEFNYPKDGIYAS